MLHELRVENLLLMERAELRLAAGLNVLTGETGAGKTLLAQALDLLLGGRARSGIVREGASEAWVEGVFALPAEPDRGEDERIPTDAQEIVLARRVWPDGRTRAYICGRAATVGDLAQLGSRLLSFYGQHEHRKLMLAGTQLEVLDAYCGSGQRVVRERVAAAHARVRELEAKAQELEGIAGARERELDLLAFELEEIEAAAPSEAEEAELVRERERLRHLETLRVAVAGAAEALAPEAGAGVGEALSVAARALESAAAIDGALTSIAARLQALGFEAQDLAGELRRYVLDVEPAPGRLEEVEERLAAFARLERKHGGSIAEVMAHAERCRARREQLEHAEVALEQVESELAGARDMLERTAEELSVQRRAAAPELAADVRAHMAELAMGEARFEVVVRPREGGIGARGADTVELLIAPNPGLPIGPLREVASGGELSRVMLALLSARGEPCAGEAGATEGGASGAGATAAALRPLLVFDEIDAGVGGHTAHAIGAHLRELSRHRQILCITHLPQIAALAERHFAIVKDTSLTPARTDVQALEGNRVIGELVRMMGGGKSDRAARQHARHLLRAA